MAGALIGLGCALALGGCASIGEKFADAPLIGLPAGTPERPATPHAYPAVHDMPPARVTRVMNEVEQHKLENDLMAALTQQQLAAGLVQPPPPREPPPPPPPPARRKKSGAAAGETPRPVPAATSAVIY